jgi:hypothetical protein
LTNLAGKPFQSSRLERTPTGTTAKYPVELIHRLVQELGAWRIRWPLDRPGAFYIASNTPDIYCQELVSEGRVLRRTAR